MAAAARNAAFRSLIKNNLLTEINAPREHVGLGRRQDDDGTWIVARITDEALRAIGIDPNAADAREEDEQSAEAITRRNAERRAAAEAAAPVADTAPAPVTPVTRDGAEVEAARSGRDGLRLALLRIEATEADGARASGEAVLTPRISARMTLPACEQA